ncbi:conserved hypothetical protein [uncultured Eubacteriales bacterium]|uniref:Uncharacterized protein n=1 Tax=uncultured Eubacteriales bacterium TaxID=172733 RepID=A0A212K0E8_9FIRM|nr:conserved hypothetical protein [uncultured Eubacteriales bacterium]
MAMYNRYIPNGTTYTRIVEDDSPARPTQAGAPGDAPEAPNAEEKKGLAGLLKSLKLDDIDTGDILLLLILLFLFLEGDDIELIITLGLILLLGLD